MHTTHITVPPRPGYSSEHDLHGRREFTCHHNGDYSGDIIVSVKLDVLQHLIYPAAGNSGPYEEVRIPFEVMRQLVANWVRDERVRKLEQADDKEVLLG